MDTQEKIKQLQVLEQSLQSLLVQKQQFQLQLAEIESAQTGLEGKENAYRIIGNIMVSAKQADLVEELNQRGETVNLRLKTLEKQEKNVRDKAEALQKEVLQEMQKNES
jgi:prefoldin beta subunit